MSLSLVTPAAEHLPAYLAALNRGWSPDNTIGGEGTRLRQLAKIAEDPDGFLASLEDLEAKGDDIVLPDGSTVKRLPGFVRWIWDGDFCGAVNFRWQAGTEDLPPHVLGHVGYGVVPWKQGRGHATQALGLLLPQVRLHGLRWIELTTDEDNVPSQKVILSNGGVLIGRFDKPAVYGGGVSLRWRVAV